MELIKKFEKGDQDDVVSVSQASEAYYVAGWIRIHADNHTAAYELWRRGAARPTSGCFPGRRETYWDQDTPIMGIFRTW